MNTSRFHILSSGVHADMPPEKAIRTRMVNIFALLATLATLGYVFVYHGSFFYLNLIFVIGFAATWWFNRQGWHFFAKIWLYTLAHVALFLSASAFGREAGEQMVLVPVLFGGVLVFQSKEKWGLIYAIILTVLTFITLELTGYSLISLDISPETRLSYYRGNLAITIISSIVAAVLYFRLYNQQIRRTEETLAISREIEETINYFSTSLFGQNTESDILWDVAKNCISRLGFEDCVIYLLDRERQVLVQKAAYGDKNPREFDIIDPIEIPVGQGIVGHVAQSGQPLFVPDTTKEPRYIEDDQFRYSELAVPLIYQDRVIGVLDSEHSQKNFFTNRHQRILKTIAALCANKVIRARADKEREKSRILQIEAEKIKEIDELKTRLLTNLSHELRTPLTMIMGTIDKHISHENDQDWHIMKKNADRLLRLINQLMDLTRLESGQFKLHPSPQDINAFFQMTVSIFESMASTHQVSIRYKGPDKPLFLNFDFDALEKIFYNLLSNAVKFTKQQSEVGLYVRYINGALIVKITDEGPGITDEERDKIFDRFYRSGDEKPGTGIGLAITRELVELHGGSISVESSGNRGSTFTVQLPLEMASVPEALSETHETRPAETLSPSGAQPLILVIEDHKEVSGLIFQILQGHYQVMQEYDGESGYEKARECLPDLIISDIMMPGKDGLELCRELKEDELTNHIPVILLTARADMDSKLAGLDTGADDYLVKPFHSEELLTRVENLLTQRKRLQEKYKKIIELQPSEVVIETDEEALLQNILKVVEQHMDDEAFGVRQLSQELNMSRMQLHRKLTALLDSSPGELIRDLRLKRAAQLLEQGELVSQVAYSVGYSSLSNFSKIFKEKYGVLPSEFNCEW